MDGYILILAVLILGGTIATLGDRIGSKVGKAKLSIFKLRPRKTATLVTIATGGLISATTLAIMLATSSQLREGLFQLESIRTELKNAQAQKQKSEQELKVSRSQISQAKLRLDNTNKQRVQALLQQAQTLEQLQKSESSLKDIQQELDLVQAKEAKLRDRNQKLQTEQQSLIAAGIKLQQEQQKLTGDLQQSKLEQSGLRQRVKDAQIRFNDLEKQRSNLLSELADLQDLRNRLTVSLQNLRLGDVAIRKEQILTVGVTKPNLGTRERQEVINQLLQQADRAARQLLEFLPDQEPKEPVVKVTEAQINSLSEKIGDGRSYAIRVQSAGNFLKRETSVFVALDLYPNRQVFKPGQVIVSLSFTPDLSQSQLEERVQRLFQLANLRATQEGVLADPITRTVGTFSPTALEDLLKAIAQIKTKYEIQAIARFSVFTASPLNLELVILNNGVEIKRFS